MVTLAYRLVWKIYDCIVAPFVLAREIVSREYALITIGSLWTCLWLHIQLCHTTVYIIVCCCRDPLGVTGISTKGDYRYQRILNCLQRECCCNNVKFCNNCLFTSHRSYSCRSYKCCCSFDYIRQGRTLSTVDFEKIMN